MKTLLKNPSAFYTPKVRPSGHDIGEGFGKDNGGAIPSNLLQIANSESNGQYLDGCRLVGETQHPARFPARFPEFFINMLTERDDIVLDVFAGSNTTGQVAQACNRRWLAFELSREYVASSAFRFLGKDNTHADMRKIFDLIEKGVSVNIDDYVTQRSLSLGANA
jgi:site-specific DNA-methyltransferase (cytosine-N4-specific)